MFGLALRIKSARDDCNEALKAIDLHIIKDQYQAKLMP